MKLVAMPSTLSPLLVFFAALLLGGCSGAPYSARHPVDVPPEFVAQSESIYFGRVFALDSESREPLFIYERRVRGEGDHITSTHITKNIEGQVVYADSAVHDASYELSEYRLHGDQLGRSGGARKVGAEWVFELQDGDELRSARETPQDPVVVGPSLVGYIVQHLPALRKGTTFHVRLLVLDRLETIGFQLKAVSAPEGQTRVEMKASSFLIALAVSPITFTFTSASNKLIRLEGRVPPKTRKGDRLKDLDARVEYTFVAAGYR